MADKRTGHIPTGTPFDRLMRRLVRVPKDEVAERERLHAQAQKREQSKARKKK